MTTNITIDQGYWFGVDSAAWLEANHEPAPELTAKFEAFCEALEDDYDRNTWSDIDLFISSHDDHDFGPSDNTYNHDSILISPVVHHQFSVDGVSYGWYRIHLGGDVRNNNYSDPVFVNFDESYSDYEGFNLYPELEAYVTEILPVVPDTIPLFDGFARVPVTGLYRHQGYGSTDLWCDDAEHEDILPENVFGLDWILESDYDQDVADGFAILHESTGTVEGENLEFVLLDLASGRRFEIHFSVSDCY